jgi:iron complex transport system ATP-binding protein
MVIRVAVSGLSFSFGEKKVLKDITFEARDGEFLGLMGPNGSGKTTLLRCITEYLKTDGRAVLVDMKPIHTLPPRELARIFAVVPQSTVTDFPFTAYDIVMMGRVPHAKGMLSGETEADVRVVRGAMDRTDTWRFASRPFTELSGGERQRVIIARAIAQEPKALLLDEPTVYLDISGQFEIMDLVKKLNREHGITVIAVLHEVNLAARYCDRIALLSDGRLETIGSPEEVLTPEIIRGVYGVDVIVRRDPFTHAVYVMPRPSPSAVQRHGTRVHVLCGGGTGGPVMKLLLDSGYSVSTGVLNVLDSDYQNANDLHLPVVAEVPFSQISPEAHAENMKLIDQAEYVIVSPFPVGPGNISNLEAAASALASGKKVFVIAAPAGHGIDFVGGRADSLIKGLISSGAVAVAGADELPGLLKVNR